MALPATRHASTTTIQALTYEDLLAIPEDGNRYELIFGEIVMSPAPKTAHQRALRNLVTQFDRLVRQHAAGEVFFAPLDVRLSTYNVVQPDLVFVSRDRLGIVQDDFIDGVPDFVIEVLSPSNRAQDLVKKAVMYASCGIAEYWIVDPDTWQILVHLLHDGEYQRTVIKSGTVQSVVIAGLQIQLSDVFEPVGGASTSAGKTE